MSAVPLRLVSRAPCPSTVTTLERLLALALAGEVVGVAACAIYRGRRYDVEITGEAHRSPTYARGAVRALDDHLSTML